MVEYIERDGVLAEYDRHHQGPPGGARKIIAEYPAADVKPVVRGKWVKQEPDTKPTTYDLLHEEGGWNLQ